MNKDWQDYVESLLDIPEDTEEYSGNEWSDEYYGLKEYRLFCEEWC